MLFTLSNWSGGRADGPTTDKYLRRLLITGSLILFLSILEMRNQAWFWKSAYILWASSWKQIFFTLLSCYKYARQIDFVTLFNFYSSKIVLFWNGICLVLYRRAVWKVLVHVELVRSANRPTPGLPLPINTVISTLPRIRDRRRRWRKGKYSRKWWTQVSLWVIGNRHRRILS